MKSMTGRNRRYKNLFFAFSLVAALPFFPVQAAQKADSSIDKKQMFKVSGVRRLNSTTAEIIFSGGRRMTIDFYGENIFRMFRDDAGGIIRDPQAIPEAQILVDEPRRPVSRLDLSESVGTITLATQRIRVEIDKETSLMKITDLRTNRPVVEETVPVSIEEGSVTVTLKEHPGEYFYGGGVQNGRFSHKGKAISIENQNSWTDGGVASPTPFYWSTNGYGVMFYTFKKGRYDFGAETPGVVRLSHESPYLDLFYMVNDGAVPLLNDFYQLTGNPVLIPKFGFYEGHLNAYNRDFWKEDEKGILFEDGKRYKESQKDNGGIKESLNGEKGNYLFSARAVIDRYKKHDMPLGWLLPNDGYGAGYGQTETLDGNIANLRSLGDYARKNGVEIGLWTQSDLHPKAGISPLLQRDIVKEVRDAGVRVLKTDVAWVGAGYSFGLNGVADVAHIMPYYGNEARPFIISLDGWAGTQRYATIWSGDQTGGVWEYIRFHIPTYIGSGLSGQPNISSDMDGIFGGKNPVVNIRDFQWKTFTPMQLNMDGWGANEKYPHALGEPATSINRMYLKLKSELLPYAYTYAKEAVDGKPLIRAMFLDYPNDYTHGTATRYQYMYGPDFLVAPIFQATKTDKAGNDVRNGIYLPEGSWVDYFTGDTYEGNRILNNVEAPLWKLPVFVRNGAIIPMTNPNNNVHEIDRSVRIYELYPYRYSEMTEYDDDGTTESYRYGKHATTRLQSDVDARGRVHITIHPAQGDFEGFVKEKTTELRINVTEKPKTLRAKVNGKRVKLTEAKTVEELRRGENVYFYDAAPNLNRFATESSDFAKQAIVKNPQLLVRLAKSDVTAVTQELTVEGFRFEPADRNLHASGNLAAPLVRMTEENTGAYTLKPIWGKVENADFYEIEANGMLYTTIRDTELLFEDLKPETDYLFNIRAVNKDGLSAWTPLAAKTRNNPLEFAIRGIKGETSVENQAGFGVNRFFDFAESGDLWHTKYGAKALPFELIVDLVTVNQLDKFWYLPRVDAGNGTLLKGSVAYSMDKDKWTDAGTFEWKRNGDTKEFVFAARPSARYIRLSVTEAVGNYGSGRELYVFKVPGTESYLPGDINNDGKIDENDLSSYMNYTGLRRGDSDFEGYISNGDINKNGLIDAYDISVVATLLNGGVKPLPNEKVGGTLSVSTAKQVYQAGEMVEVRVKGNDLKAVNALSFALPYDQEEYEFVGVEPLQMKAMENLTYDRLHTNGMKALYPTFVNLGMQETLEGSVELFVLKFKAKKRVRADWKPADGMLVDRRLGISAF
ncbi:TIM-barrel domain-containing protein [Bacteroides pyogenes]|uniref:TIM-barrel domain-containing protein n=1 Tax=Bacteroides pyogenes TaxID=310300 RepID=UPI0040639395